MTDLPPAFLELLASITAKRAKTVIDHILKHGHISTEELKELYGYSHPPRAARDVREQGIPLETIKLQDSQGRQMAGYKFGDLSQIVSHKLGGRQVFSKHLKAELYEKQNGRCAICHQEYEARYLQIDHRVPYEVAGDSVADETDKPAFMLICASCQRSKSWTCEHCVNWQSIRDIDNCKTCYWGSPEAYKHIAMTATRREVVIWTGDGNVALHDKLDELSKADGLTVAEYMRKKAEDGL